MQHLQKHTFKNSEGLILIIQMLKTDFEEVAREVLEDGLNAKWRRALVGALVLEV